MISQDQARDLIGGTLYGSDGEKIGRIGQLFLDDETGRPEWLIEEAVPVQRVCLGKETVEDQVTVSDEVRKEQIEEDIR
jgi:sporulation protein YlmC with PRC-barrel domain